MSSPYPLFSALWPFAVLLILMCCPTSVRRWVLTRLKWLGLAIGLLLIVPYLFS